MTRIKSVLCVPVRAAMTAVVAACLGLLGPSQASVGAQEPARATAPLLQLIPPDSGLVLAIDDLRGQYKELLASRILDGFSKTSIVRDWMDSDKYREQQAGREQVERMLQLTWDELRDDILGDAVVFSVHLPADAADPNLAKGIVVLKARAPEKLSRLIGMINEIQRNNGELDDVARRRQGETEFSVRKFPAGSNKPDEVYVSFPDGVFALSNSEPLVRDLIDRKAGKSVATPAAGGRAALARFQELDRRLPGRAIARLFVDPRILERLLRNANAPRNPGEAMLRRGILAQEAVGMALVAGDRRIALHVAQTFDSSKFDELIGPWAAVGKAAKIDRIPDATLAVAAVQMKIAGLYELARLSIPGTDLPRVENLESVAKGLLLGQDPRHGVLPLVGPQATLAVGEPASWERRPDASPGRFPLPVSLAVELGGTRDAKSPNEQAALTAGAAIDNALQTALAGIALEGKHGGGKGRVVTREVAGIAVRTLDPPVPAAYALDRAGRRIVLGTSVEAVGHALTPGADSKASDRFRRIQAGEFPEAQSFICVDLAALHAMIAAHGDAIVERLAHGQDRRESVRKDLSHLDEVLGQFDAAYWSGRLEKDPATLVHVLGLVPRADSTPARP